MLLLCYCYVIVMLLLCHCYVIVMLLLCYCYVIVIVMLLLCYLRQNVLKTHVPTLIHHQCNEPTMLLAYWPIFSKQSTNGHTPLKSTRAQYNNKVPPPHPPTHPPTPRSTPNRQWNVNDLNSLMLMSSMLMLVVLMWWYLSCPAKITLWASASWPSSQARVTSAKSLSFLKFLIFQLCHSYWPNISSENMGSSTKTQQFTSHGFRKSESLGVQDSGSHNIENARKILHFDIFSFSCLNPSISEKKKKIHSKSS